MMSESTNKVPRDQYPWWVKLSIWGLPNRAAVQLFVWLSIALAIACVPLAMFLDQPCFSVGVPILPGGALLYLPVWWLGVALFPVSALLYQQSVAWIDRHGSWDRNGSSPEISSSPDQGAPRCDAIKPASSDSVWSPPR